MRFLAILPAHNQQLPTVQGSGGILPPTLASVVLDAFQQFGDLGGGQDDGQALVVPGAPGTDSCELDHQDFPVEKEKGVERLVLRNGGQSEIDSDA